MENDNSIFRCIKERRSVRSYSNKNVSKEIIENIVNAGKYAPSAEDRQPWKFIIITNREAIATLSDEVKQQIKSVLAKKRKFKKQYPELNENEVLLFLKVVSESQKDIIFYDAPVVVLILTQDKVFNDESCAACAQNMMLAAWELGIGSCWIGFAKFLDANIQVKGKLGIPQGEHIAACLIFGYPEHIEKASIRKPTAIIINWIE